MKRQQKQAYEENEMTAESRLLFLVIKNYLKEVRASKIKVQEIFLALSDRPLLHKINEYPQHPHLALPCLFPSFSASTKSPSLPPSLPCQMPHGREGGSSPAQVKNFLQIDPANRKRAPLFTVPPLFPPVPSSRR
ncbi:hypothetical protein ONS96_014246 [Cadophora gregata f. sp. sojae]|nr:hypothetical protein ONS96_014246 [Cadophora gregata f. sp. sojae]